MENGGFIFWILVVFAAIWYWSTGDGRGEISGYTASCTNDAIVAPLAYAYAGQIGLKPEQLRSSIRKCKIAAGAPTVFSVNTQNDTVTYRFGNLPSLDKQRNCTILNKKNWVCRYKDGSGSIGFRDGLESMAASEVTNGFFYQRRWQHLLTKTLNMLGVTPQATWLIPDQVTSY